MYSVRLNLTSEGSVITVVLAVEGPIYFDITNACLWVLEFVSDWVPGDSGSYLVTSEIHNPVTQLHVPEERIPEPRRFQQPPRKLQFILNRKSVLPIRTRRTGAADRASASVAVPRVLPSAGHIICCMTTQSSVWKCRLETQINPNGIL